MILLTSPDSPSTQTHLNNYLPASTNHLADIAAAHHPPQIDALCEKQGRVAHHYRVPWVFALCERFLTRQQTHSTNVRGPSFRELEDELFVFSNFRPLRMINTPAAFFQKVAQLRDLGIDARKEILGGVFLGRVLFRRRGGSEERLAENR